MMKIILGRKAKNQPEAPKNTNNPTLSELEEFFVPKERTKLQDYTYTFVLQKRKK